MYWVALDRAVELAGSIGSNADRVSRWREERDEIRRAILEQGWSGRAGAFIQTFAGEALDASTLLLPIVGFLPADDERVRATVEAVAQRLTDSRGLVYKYKTEDGLEGRRARSCSAPSGYPTHSRSADSWTGPERCSSELRRMPTISVSWRKKSTALPASSWGTFPRP